MRERDGTHDKSLVHFDGFVRRSSDGVLVNILKRRGTKIFSKEGGYDLRGETLQVTSDVKNDGYPTGQERTKIWRISLRLGLAEARMTRFPASLLIPGICSAWGRTTGGCFGAIALSPTTCFASLGSSDGGEYGPALYPPIINNKIDIFQSEIIIY